MTDLLLPPAVYPPTVIDPWRLRPDWSPHLPASRPSCDAADAEVAAPQPRPRAGGAATGQRNQDIGRQPGREVL